ncbi:hypothetical protein B0H14DRAFT_3782980 [Mycena olivaceomarginata]|nr:hypothetical protein B0H14DRAFT_3782980 [Mycena olivaceomarginata]
MSPIVPPAGAPQWLVNILTDSRACEVEVFIHPKTQEKAFRLRCECGDLLQLTRGSTPWYNHLASQPLEGGLAESVDHFLALGQYRVEPLLVQVLIWTQLQSARRMDLSTLLNESDSISLSLPNARGNTKPSSSTTATRLQADGHPSGPRLGANDVPTAGGSHVEDNTSVVPVDMGPPSIAPVARPIDASVATSQSAHPLSLQADLASELPMQDGVVHPQALAMSTSAVTFRTPVGAVSHTTARHGMSAADWSPYPTHPIGCTGLEEGSGTSTKFLPHTAPADLSADHDTHAGSRLSARAWYPDCQSRRRSI